MLSEIIYFLVPNAEFSYIGNPQTESEYDDNVVWMDERPQPHWKEIQKAKPEVEKKIKNLEQQMLRRDAFKNEADPLFFGWQRGENEKNHWLVKVEEIRARYPYVE